MTNDAKEQLLLELLPHIKAEAQKLSRRSRVPAEDLSQEGSLFAWRAMDRMDESKGYRAWTFLRYRVVGAMKDYIRSKRHLLGSTQYHELPWVRSLSLPSNRVDGHATSLGDTVPDTHADLDDAINLDAFEVILRRCYPKERVLLRRIFITGETRTDIAEEQGVAISAVAQRAQVALGRIRETMKGE